MKKHQLVIFDLDGTLTDSAQGIVNSVQYALDKMGMVENDRLKLQAFIGPPLISSFQEFYGLGSGDAWQAVQYYREYFVVNGMFENQVYPGIPVLLDELHHSGRILAVATSKPGVYARQILAHFDLLQYFSQVAGSNLDGSLIDKGELIALVIEQYQHLPVQEIIMVGDRKYDVEGARVNGIESAAVAYGYGSREELLRARPSYIAESVKELQQLLG